MRVKAAEDPVDRYRRLVAPAPPPAELRPAALEAVLTQGRSGDGEVSALSKHVAQHSRLTVPDVEATVATALEGATGTQAKAAAVSTAITAMPTGEVQLNDPVMLNGWARVSFAAALGAAVGACIWQIATLGQATRSQESAIICLTVLAAFALVGVLVLAMGYKNVTIKGGAAS